MSYDKSEHLDGVFQMILSPIGYIIKKNQLKLSYYKLRFNIL